MNGIFWSSSILELTTLLYSSALDYGYDQRAPGKPMLVKRNGHLFAPLALLSKLGQF